ncbi:polyprenyl synthetase family protein [Lysinibacillus antri]|uniref:Polyprenyl synthetase family protein n=1 Tax=Lysinibacillus antri TaxID=2498145 RepID=A0A432L7N7_9BACI|nr:polyprenyl synthetase family protein [Lysinibacillus antri]RUL47902.1 polyprenyl synthetase family protein [Lysinibacillus antri]
MNDVNVFNAEVTYQHAEEKAAQYFQQLENLIVEKTFDQTLIEDFLSWKVNHIHHPGVFSLFTRKKQKPSTKMYHQYIQWLNFTNKLESYLDRSISYLYLRDLGKQLNHPETVEKIQTEVERLKHQLLDSSNSTNQDMFSLATLFRKAQKEGIELTFVWLMNKLNEVANNIPDGLDAVNARRKLIKIIAGVLMHTLDQMDESVPAKERTEKLDKAIRLGYSYGLTYPFVDDLLDSQLLTEDEKIQYSEIIRIALITGDVPNLGEQWSAKSLAFLQYIHGELREAFEYIKRNQTSSSLHKFFEQAYVFFNSQEVDRRKKLTNAHYTNEDIYIPIILKSASSRLIARSVISVTEDDGFEERTFLYGIYNQLADDFADMFDDLKDGAVTPYTYYLTHHHDRKDLINPFELYWCVICHLIHTVYESDARTREVILDRAINGLKRFKEKHGTQKYSEVMKLFASGLPQFNKVLQKMVDNADDVDFFDKLLRDRMIETLKNDKEDQEQFKEKVKSVRERLNLLLTIQEDSKLTLFDDSIHEAANYSLGNGGKRLRPIITWFTGGELYGLNETSMLPLLKSLEYMHTASLIFDDLPSQDNASLRRGHKTVHEVYNVATAELTGLFLTQRAIEEQTLLQYPAEVVLELIRYTAQMTANMCKGQLMDLESKGARLSLEQLNTMCFYKTGLGFEAALLMPAILAKANNTEKELLKRFAKHAGIAFQIKDDLLDVEGKTAGLGKQSGIDSHNNSSTFVTVLGMDQAKIEMWEHYCLAMEVVEELPRGASFLKHMLNYLVNREN